MVILADTREQKLLPIREGGVVETIERTALPVADYMCRFRDNSIPPLAFERKSISDLWGTMLSGYGRFKVEMEKAKRGGIELVLILEASFSDVLDGFPRSKFSGDSMVKKLFTLQVRHGVRTVFCNSRLEAARYIVEAFEAVGREKYR